MISPTLQVLLPAVLSFWIGIGLTPTLTHYLYKYKAWKKKPGKYALDGTLAEGFNKIHEKNEVRAPRFGGIVVWASVLLTTLCFWLIGQLHDDSLSTINFLSRSETWIPLAALMAGAVFGFLDDLLIVRPEGEGLPLAARLSIVTVLATFGGLWFYWKLGVVAVSIPFAPALTIGWLIIPLFILMSLGLYASGVIDGIDGLSGGVFASVFAAYAIIAFGNGEIQLAAFCAATVGGLLAFLWFNIPPARFYMSDTGTMALTLSLSAVAFLTDNIGGGVGIFVMPIVGALLVVTVLSNILQVVWKRLFGKKIFLIAPLHHHFEALGWPGYKVVMRYWVLSVVFAFAGAIIALSVK
jgi:phospho-N-acetylmuramoyl-pentapeptide-transferase